MRALLVGLLAFVLVTQAAAAAMQAPSAPTSRKASVAKRTPTLDQQLERKLVAIRKFRGAIRGTARRPGIYRVTIQALDSLGRAATGSLTLTVR